MLSGESQGWIKVARGRGIFQRGAPFLIRLERSTLTPSGTGTTDLKWERAS